MIELGKIQHLEIIRKSDIGAYLNSKESKNEQDILLPKKQLPIGSAVGDEIEVFVYRDSEDRLIATTKKPKITLGQLAYLEVIEKTKIGAFLDWGLDKDLFLPFKQQIGQLNKGDSYLVGIYIDKSDRLCATMKVYDLLSCASPYEVNQRAKGLIYTINEENGAFVAVDHKYHGLIPIKELIGEYKVGDTVDVRVQKVRHDGKLELSLRKQTFNQIEDDSRKIMQILKDNNGKLNLNDSSSPAQIKKELNMSKAAFKRAVGRLMKEGAVRMTDTGIELSWS